VLNQSHGISNQPSSTSSFSSAAVSYALGILGQLREYKLHFAAEEHHRQLVRIDSATGADCFHCLVRRFSFEAVVHGGNSQQPVCQIEPQGVRLVGDDR
jgi:hypothetical protein